MSRAPLESEPGELLRRLAQENLPSSPEDAAPARRDRLVRAMKDVVEHSAEKAEKRRRFRRGGVMLAAAAGFLLLSGLLLEEHGSQVGPSTIAGLDRVSGTVVLTEDGKGRVVGSGERAVRDGDSLQTATGAHAHLLTSKSSVNVSEATELKLSRPSPAEERISLRRGRVDLEVQKAVETKRAVVVETPDAEVVVRGTVFDVRVDPLANATNTHVHVTRGSVWVLAQGVQVALLSAGQSWNSSTGVEAADAHATATPTPTLVAAPQSPVEVTPAPVAVKAASTQLKDNGSHASRHFGRRKQVFLRLASRRATAVTCRVRSSCSTNCSTPTRKARCAKSHRSNASARSAAPGKRRAPRPRRAVTSPSTPKAPPGPKHAISRSTRKSSLAARKGCRTAA